MWQFFIQYEYTFAIDGIYFAIRRFKIYFDAICRNFPLDTALPPMVSDIIAHQAFIIDQAGIKVIIYLSLHDKCDRFLSRYIIDDQLFSIILFDAPNRE